MSTSKCRRAGLGLLAYVALAVFTTGCNMTGVKASSTGPPSGTTLVISNVAAGGITSSSATVTWTTNQAATSQVEYGTTSGYGSTTALDTTQVTNHSQNIGGLSANTVYHYRVHSKGTDGNDVASADSTFSTLNSGGMSGLQPQQLGLLINDSDPYSVAVGAYYQSKRNIPGANVLHVSLPTTRDLNGPGESGDLFTPLKKQVDAMPSQIQILAIAWGAPSRVLFKDSAGDHINSITSALGRGLVPGVLFSLPGVGSCWAAYNTPQPYYDSSSTQPYTDLGIRPAMLLASSTDNATFSVSSAEAMIDRGVAADGTFPHGKAHVLNTSDPKRNLRAVQFPSTNLGSALSPYIDVVIDNADSVSGTIDTLFYFAGTASVADISTNRFPPGAMGDHLTSDGGILPDGAGQMPATVWIAEGETGTYGTVDEPCGVVSNPTDVTTKFDNPSILIKHYTSGETLIEAYWKSVYETYQGLFIGEPLAHPWR